MNNRNEPSIFNNIVQQSKGAGKLVLLIVLAIAALNIWIMKDNRHFSIVIVPDSYSVMAVSSDQRDAFNQFQVGE